MVENKPLFRAYAPGRHPKIDRDYDARSHRFKEEYINPKEYRLVIDAFPDMEIIPEALEGPQGTFEPICLPGDPDRPICPPEEPEKLVWAKLKVPDDMVGIYFSVKSADRSFVKELSKSKSELILQSTTDDLRWRPQWQWDVAVPSLGSYDLTFQIRTRSGLTQAQEKRITIRDFLVVSIGDSAASGQGVPDVPGHPDDAFKPPDWQWWNVFVPPVYLYRLSIQALEWGWNVIKRNSVTIARAGSFSIKMDPPPVWLEPKAYRSLRSGHAVAARMLQDVDKGIVVTFLPFGRTGSTVRNGLLGPRTGVDEKWIGKIGQIEEVSASIGSKQIDALLIYIGVNDVGVAGGLQQLVTGDLSLTAGGHPRPLVRNAAKNNLQQLWSDLEKLAEEIAAKLNVRHVFLTEYMSGLFDNKRKQPANGCELFASDVPSGFGVGQPLTLDDRDAALIQELADNLNKKLESFVGHINDPLNQISRGTTVWHYVPGISDNFRGQGYCMGSKSLYVTASASLVTQGDTEGTIHPNERGHDLIGRMINKSVRETSAFYSVPNVWLEPSLHMMMG